MKKIVALAFTAFSFASVSQARMQNNGGDVYLAPQVEACSRELYINLSTYSSSTDEACSFGRTDSAFQACTINTTRRFKDDSQVVFAGFLCARGVGATDYRTQNCVAKLTDFFGSQYLDYSLTICRRSSNTDFANCVTELYRDGGQEVENDRLRVDGFRMCQHATNHPLNRCIIENHRYNGLSGVAAAQSCLEKFDPAVRYRKEAEQRAIEQRRTIEQRRAEERRRIEEQRRREQQQMEQFRRQKQAQFEQQRRLEELRRLEEKRRTEDQRVNREKIRVDLPSKPVESAKKQQQPELQKKQEEARQQEEQRKQQETLKQAEQKKQQELAKQQEQQRKQEEQRKNEEARKKDEEQKSESDKSSTENNDEDGVIVDLPNF